MSVVLKCLKTWMFAGLSFLKISWLFILTIVPLHGMMSGVKMDSIWIVAINFVSFSIIFSSAMSVRTTCIILKEMREGERRLLNDLL